MMQHEIVNKMFTMGQLAEKTGADLSRWKLRYGLDRELSPRSFASGRANYIWIQELICYVSGGMWDYGGQGKSEPDFWMGEDWCEAKAYDKEKPHLNVDVAASSFFANNCKVKDHKALLEESATAAKNFLFKHSYDGNDYYLLTSTRNLDCELEEIEMVFVETDLLIECLDPKSHFKKVNMSQLFDKVGRI
jgi:hypothetical protein|tara:strand:- start:2379 stop:2951 length:573 start_codon:yes stop_codon:yes gene_type:complete